MRLRNIYEKYLHILVYLAYYQLKGNGATAGYLCRKPTIRNKYAIEEMYANMYLWVNCTM